MASPIVVVEWDFSLNDAERHANGMCNFSRYADVIPRAMDPAPVLALARGLIDAPVQDAAEGSAKTSE